jgi:hypothetical protein
MTLLFTSLIFLLILSYLILSYLILSYLILSYLILSYLILSYLILSYLILSYLILSYPILLFEFFRHTNCFSILFLTLSPFFSIPTFLTLSLIHLMHIIRISLTASLSTSLLLYFTALGCSSVAERTAQAHVLTL